MIKKLTFLLLASALISSSLQAQKQNTFFNVKNFGAKADGKTFRCKSHQ